MSKREKRSEPELVGGNKHGTVTHNYELNIVSNLLFSVPSVACNANHLVRQVRGGE